MRSFKSALAIALLFSSTLGAVAVSANALPLPALIFARPQRQAGSGVPYNLGTATGRGECPQLEALVPTETPVVEIMPGQTQEKPTQSWGMTASDTPKIWFRVNQSVPGARFEMVLKSGDDSIVGTFEKTLSATDRLFAMSIPADSLVHKGKFYSFVGSMQVECSEIEGIAPQMQSLSNGGWIQRVDPPAGVTALEDPKELAKAYAEAGLWFDALNIIVELHQMDPTDAWVNAALAELNEKMQPVESLQK